jgi:hypothetical protein
MVITAFFAVIGGFIHRKLISNVLRLGVVADF